MPSSPFPTPRARASAAAAAASIAARVPYPIWALAILAAFAAFFPFIADDYGLGPDDGRQREIGVANLQYILGDEDALPKNHFKYYGAAFEMPALLAERAFRLTDSRDVFLIRRLLTHLLFLGGAFACYILAYRLFKSVPIAALAMLLFLAHPRLYAHSIFNSKDSPFLAMFMITLLAAHWAFAKNSVWAFAVLGVCAGLAANLRIMGIVFVPAALGLRICDLLFAPPPTAIETRQNTPARAIAACAAFAAAAAGAYFVLSPYLWSAPLSFLDAREALSNMRDAPTEPYQGDLVRGSAAPWHYIPVWIWITTPPLTLLFAAAGAAAVIRRGAANPEAVLRGGDIRFGLLLIALAALPIIAAAALGFDTYNGWRHMHFLYAPLVLLAAFALHWLPREFKPGPLRTAARWGTLALMCAGLAASLTTIVMLHPNQQIYFNFFVDRETPERLRKQYTMDYWTIAQMQGLRHLLEIHPSGPVFTTTDALSAAYILPMEQRRRVIIDADDDPTDKYHIPVWWHMDSPIYEGMDEIHSVNIYNSTAMAVYGDASKHQAKADEYAARLREMSDALAAREPSARAYYDVYADAAENSVVYLKAPCANADIASRFFLHITPVNPDDLSLDRKPHGFDNADFILRIPPIENPPWSQSPRTGGLEFASVWGEICLASVSLPDYPIARVETGQFNEQGGGKIWSAVVDLAAAERKPPDQTPTPR